MCRVVRVGGRCVGPGAAAGGAGLYLNDVHPRGAPCGGERVDLVESAAALPPTASCYACHSANTAVDNTFVQFYPELFAVAKAKGTIKATYDPSKKP